MMPPTLSRSTQPEQHTPPVGPQWYVAHSQPLKERYAAQNLGLRLGLTVFLPEVRRHFRGQVEEAPLFPRYLFVKADLGVTAVSRINATEGVARLVSFGGAPLAVPGEIVRGLYERVAALNSEGGLVEHGFQAGEMVAVVGGPLCGLEAIFLGPMEPNQRVQVLIDLLGGLQRVEIDVDDLTRRDGEEVVVRNALSNKWRPRRSRGKRKTK